MSNGFVRNSCAARHCCAGELAGGPPLPYEILDEILEHVERCEFEDESLAYGISRRCRSPRSANGPERRIQTQAGSFGFDGNVSRIWYGLTNADGAQGVSR